MISWWMAKPFFNAASCAGAAAGLSSLCELVKIATFSAALGELRHTFSWKPRASRAGKPRGLWLFSAVRYVQMMGLMAPVDKAVPELAIAIKARC